MIVSLTAFQRPDLLEQTLAAFAVAVEEADEEVALVARVEPSPHKESILRELAPHASSVTVNDQRLGLQKNTLLVLRDAWGLADTAGDDFVLHLEDDLVIAPDALRLAAWMRDHYRDDGNVPFVALTQTGECPTDPDAWMAVSTSPWFECHVWGTWRPGWEELLAAWPHEWPNHWAQRVNDSVMAGRLQARPLLSRSASVGVYGVHCNPYYHERHNPNGAWAAHVDLPAGDYRVAGLVTA